MCCSSLPCCCCFGPTTATKGTVPGDIPEPDELTAYGLDADLSGNMLDNWPDQRDGERRAGEGRDDMT